MTENKKHPIDRLVYQAVFGTDGEKRVACFQIWQKATQAGIIPSSINDFYMARVCGEVPSNICTPAMNVRGMTYDAGRAAFKVARENNVGAFVFEIARSEMAYTHQTPQEYVIVLMAAALREGWTGPLFVQGDHFQAKAVSPGIPKDGEIDSIKELVREAVKAGFYNIDIDMSTLVDLSKPIEMEQQQPNIKYSLEMAKFVREMEPEGITISLGGEIGHIGGKNSTIEDFHAYMKGFNSGLDAGMTGMSKISVATGTHHGGVVLADGSLADISVDFSILSSISKEGREKYNIGGAVQHGASTLPDDFFSEFPKSEAVEVHLATGIQNITMDCEAFPKDLLEKMYEWLDQNKQDERESDMTDEQFHYKLRKKAWGEFKQATWDIDENAKFLIRQTLEKRFSFFFKVLNVVNSAELVNKFVKPVVVEKTEDDFIIQEKNVEDVRGLSD